LAGASRVLAAEATPVLYIYLGYGPIGGVAVGNATGKYAFPYMAQGRARCSAGRLQRCCMNPLAAGSR